MGSTSIRDGDSLSASSFLLPHLRHSRRGSLASISSANQIDKEVLSQALDQIHNTASQTETLTTFNEYTSPPTSSAGPDTKSIAGELQGGLSGLYNRFRASVNNVKDVVGPGIEDVAVETVPSKSPRATTYSPRPLPKSGFDSARDPNSSNSTTQVTSATGSGRQSPLGNADAEGEHHETRRSFKPSTKSLGSASASAKSLVGSFAVLKPPPATLTQAAQLTTISPALADVNVSAVKRVDTNADVVSNIRHTASTESQRIPRYSRRQSYLAEPSAQGGTETPETAPSEGPISRNVSQGGPKQQRDGPGPIGANSTFKLPDRPEVVGLRSASTDSVRPFPDLEDEPDVIAHDAASLSSDANKNRLSRPAMSVTNHGTGQDDMFNGSNSKSSRGSLLKDAATKGEGYEHMNLPLQKTGAPPLITRSHLSNLNPSRASISDTESIDTSPLPISSRMHPTGSQEQIPVVNNYTVHRDSRTMNVFSQVKNKVLNKQYWMKDENARDCFYCGDSFSTFRRKHHCSKS